MSLFSIGFYITCSFRKSLFLLVFLCFITKSNAQENYDFVNPGISDPETQALFSKYLVTIDSAEAKVKELLDAARRAEFFNQIKILQVALILESYVDRPSPVTFEFNRYLGDLFTDLNLNLSLHHYEKAIAIGIRASEPTDKFSVYNILAGLYLRKKDHVKARLSYQYAIGELNKKGITEASSVYNNIGWFYSKIGNSDSALWYLNKALASYPIKELDDLSCNILENIGKEEERSGKYAEALKKFRDNTKYYTDIEWGFPNLMRNQVNVLRARIAMKEKALSPFIDSLDRFSVQNFTKVNPKDVISFYQLAHDHFLSVGDLRRVGNYFGRINHLKDSLTKADVARANALSGILLDAQSHNFKMAYDAYTLELQAAHASSNKNKVIAVLAVVLGLLVIAALASYFNKRRKEMEILKKVAASELRAKELEAKTIKAELENVRLQTEGELKQKELEAQRMQNQLELERMQTKLELETKDLERRAVQNELEFKKKDLTNIVLLNTQMYEKNKEMIERLQGLVGSKDAQVSLKSLLQDLRSANQVEERLSSLQNNIDHLNTAFYDKLKARFPGLTKAEVELCGHILINLTNKDISILKNIEPGSVKMSRNRLRKKLGLLPADDLGAFIKSI